MQAKGNKYSPRRKEKGERRKEKGERRRVLSDEL